MQVPNFVSSPLPILALFLINGEFLACLWFPLCDYSTLADSYAMFLKWEAFLEKKTMFQVCGYAAQQAKAPLIPYSFERRDPREHDVLIEIKYSGICHSDIHQVSHDWGGSTFPMVPGHEIVGIVSEIGTQVSRYKIGDRACCR